MCMALPAGLVGTGADIVCNAWVFDTDANGRIVFASRPPATDEDALVRQHWQMIKWFADKQVRASGGDFDHAVSDAALRALKAIRSHDPRRGSLSTVIFTALSRRDRARKGDALHGAMDLEEASDVPDRNVHSPDAALEREDTHRVIHEALHELDSQERAVVEGFMNEKGTAQMAKELDLCPDTIPRIRHRAFGKLRDLLSGEI